MSDILLRAENGILNLGFNRPDKMNSITSSMYTEIINALNAAESNSEIRVVVIHGNSQVFSAGNDLAEFLNLKPETANDKPGPVWEFLSVISRFPKPILAMVCGQAVGIGTTLLLHCDLVYATASAKFSMPFVNLGLSPEGASSILLPQMMGQRHASELLLLGDSFDAEQAVNLGLVNRVIPAEEIEAFVLAQAKKLTLKPMTSILETKRALKSATAQAVKDVIESERKIFVGMLSKPAVGEAVAAFREKRKPDFSKC